MNEMQTAAQKAVHKARAQRQEEEAPTLIGQLKMLREEWGEESFDGDIAQPLAALVATLRRLLEAQGRAHEREIDDLADKVAGLQFELEDEGGAKAALDRLRDDLADVPRGVRTLEEILASHAPVP